MQDPAPQLIFREVNGRHREDQNVVQCDGYGSGDFVAPENPCNHDGEQSFQRVKRRKPKKHPDGRTKRDGVRRIRNCHERHVMVAQPLFEAGHGSGQTRPVTD